MMDLDQFGAKLDEHFNKIAKMNNDLYSNIESLLNIYNLFTIRHSLPSMRNWAVSPDFAMIIINQIIRKKPKKIVELGSGVSTLLISYTLEKLNHGSLISIEHDEYDFIKTKNQIIYHSLQEYVSLLQCPLKIYELDGKEWQWYDLSNVPIDTIDMLIVDGPPGNIQALSRYPALPLLDERINSHSLVLCDDANRSDEKEVLELWEKEFPHYYFEYVNCEKGGVILHK